MIWYSNNILVYSSVVFISNFINARLHGYHSYSTWFYVLTVTSILMHGFFSESLIMNLIDKIPIIAIVTTGGVILFEKAQFNTSSLIALSTFICVCYLYCYGYTTEQYCFDPDIYISKQYHAILHLISSIGHHAIIYL
jgi:ribose/xylose/arabinose/galactoside ABC-type transport system permease subunit